MRTSISQISSASRHVARFACACSLVACMLNAARGEYVAKAFYATFDDGTVVTGTFAGDTGDDGVLVTDYDVLDIYEVDEFTLEVYAPGHGDLGAWLSRSWEYTRPFDSDEDFLWWFYYDTHDNRFYFLVWDYDDTGLAFSMESQPDVGTYYDAWQNPFSTRLFGSPGPEDFLVTISDIGTGLTFQMVEDHIAAGLAVRAIDNSGIAGSLTNMLEAAGSAVARNDPEAAAQILDAFRHRVETQSDKHLSPVMARLLSDDATAVIEWLLE
jgi:FIMAH domain